MLLNEAIKSRAISGIKTKKPTIAFRDRGLLNNSVLRLYRFTPDPPLASSKAHRRELHGGTSWTQTTPAP